MSKFNVGDVVAKPGSRYLYKITASYEGFSAATHLSEISKQYNMSNRKYFLKNIIIDDYNNAWVKIKDIIKPKFKIDENVFFTLDVPWSDENGAIVDGQIYAVVGELQNVLDLDSAHYIYVIKRSGLDSTHAIKQNDIFKNINMNNVWNSLVENSK